MDSTKVRVQVGKSVWVVMLLTSLLALSLTVGCSSSQGGSSASSGAESSSASSSASESEAAPASDAAKEAFVGTWELVGYEGEDGTDYSDRFQELRDEGYESFINLEENGIAVQVIFGMNNYGEWFASDEDSGTIDLLGAPCDMSIEGSHLTFEAAGFRFLYEKGTPRKALDKKEYLAIIDSLEGEWEWIEAYQDGVSLGEITDKHRLTIEGTTATFSKEGNTLEQNVAVMNETKKAYLGSPKSGYEVSLSDDGLLSVDLGEGRAAVYERVS